MLTYDAQELLDLIHANERAEDFDLRDWFSRGECGTYGCLVGNHLLEKFEGQPLEDIKNIHLTKVRNAITSPCWLQSVYGCQNEVIRFLFYESYSGFSNRVAKHDPHDKEAAINRVRKFLYYAMRKSDLMSGGSNEYEQARQTGHAGVSEHVEQSCNDAIAELV